MDIIVVEDTKLTRFALVDLLKSRKGLEVVAAVESAEEALEILSQASVDLVILDLCLPGISYDQAVKAIKGACPKTEILVFTVSEQDEMVFRAIKAGAVGYILKGASSAEILAAIESIKIGGSPMSPSIARKIIREFQAPGGNISQEIVSPLSKREIEILNMLYRGFDTAHIADRLCISPHTVHTHNKKIYSKLQVNTRAQAIYVAVQNNLIKP